MSGFGTNSQIEITNAGSNSGSYTVATVSGAVITLQEHDRVQPNTLTTTSLFFTDSGAYKIRRTDALQWVAKASFVVGQTITISGTGGTNDGTFTITSIVGDTLTVAEAVTDQTASATLSRPTATLTQTNPHVLWTPVGSPVACLWRIETALFECSQAFQEGFGLGETGRPCGTGWYRHPALAGQLPRAHLVAEQFEQFGARPDEGDAGFGASPGEPGILAEESVPGVNRVAAGLLSDRHDLLPVEVRGGAGAAQLAGFVSPDDV